jgi:hypothetical protein
VTGGCVATRVGNTLLNTAWRICLHVNKKDLGMLAENILGIILTKFSDQVYAWTIGTLDQANIIYGIIGLTVIISFTG